jgi:pimeloyl-ACP methyl ester carboxylesterase
MTSPNRRLLLVSLVVVESTLVASAQQPRMIDIGGRRLAVYCEGEPARFPTVILIPAGGSTARDWAQVQPRVAAFARVCSYDHASQGASDKAPVQLQSVDEVVDDLQGWLKASNEKGPFIIVAHSIAGLYARRFVTKYPEPCH